MVRLGQALLPNQENVVVHETHLYWPVFYVHNYNPQYEQDYESPYHETYSLYMTSFEKSSQSHHGQQKNVTW